LLGAAIPLRDDQSTPVSPKLSDRVLKKPNSPKDFAGARGSASVFIPLFLTSC
jgi:hypothetical protein